MDVNAEKSQILEIAISKALDHKAAHREMTSVLISDLYGKVLSSKDVMNGFDAILDSLAELTIDTPEAPSVSTYSETIVILGDANNYLRSFIEDFFYISYCFLLEIVY